MSSCLRSHHDRASGHFFSEALRFRRAREVGGKDRRTPLAYTSHSNPWPSCSLAACLAHPSAISCLGIPLCAGHQRISISRRLPFAQGCYRRPGPGSPCVIGLCIGENVGSAKLSPLGPLRCHCQGARYGGARRVVRLLRSPMWTFLPAQLPSSTPSHTLPPRSRPATSTSPG